MTASTRVSDAGASQDDYATAQAEITSEGESCTSFVDDAKENESGNEPISDVNCAKDFITSDDWPRPEEIKSYKERCKKYNRY